MKSHDRKEKMKEVIGKENNICKGPEEGTTLTY